MLTSSYVDTCKTIWDNIDGLLLSIRPRLKQECCCEKIETVEVCPCELEHMKQHIFGEVKCTGITNSDIDRLVDSLDVKDKDIKYGSNILSTNSGKEDNVNDVLEILENIVPETKTVKRKTTKVNRGRKPKTTVSE